ncbi:MAG: helix-turn-helix domain-containing protein [Rhodoferax sp.]|nr:helix-turn-helix domain-containing protein [Rhodoferax sp.]
MQQALTPSPEQRLQLIDRARHAVLDESQSPAVALSASWIERSWRRCLSSGLRPEQEVAFNVVPAQAVRHTEEANHTLVQAARPVLEKLGRAIIDTRYFIILTNAQGVVVDVSGAIDRADRRADAIARVGVDLSERSVGTSAIGAALGELRPVWLHRGEHFFSSTSFYSCAGAPLFGPDGRCAGMLDLTGIDAVERPEFKHLAAQSACRIENALLLGQPHALMVRLNWPGHTLGFDADGLVCLDADGWVVGANQIARQMVSQLATPGHAGVHIGDVFGIPYQLLFDAAKRQNPVIEVPLWSGLRLNALPMANAETTHGIDAGAGGRTTENVPLKDLETALIRKAVDDARGNVAQAAHLLGISRATVYRKLNNKKHH